MVSNDDAKSVLLDILRVGLLRIRGLANSNRADACAVEADHLHNLPTLIQSFHWEGLHNYLYIEKPAFQASTDCNDEEFIVLWEKLACLLHESQKD